MCVSFFFFWHFYFSLQRKIYNMIYDMFKEFFYPVKTLDTKISVNFKAVWGSCVCLLLFCVFAIFGAFYLLFFEFSMVCVCWWWSHFCSAQRQSIEGTSSWKLKPCSWSSVPIVLHEWMCGTWGRSTRECISTWRQPTMWRLCWPARP